MDIDICGSNQDNSPNNSFNTSFELSTPIRKIKYLSLNSPKSGNKSPIYPNLDDIVISPPDKENYHARTNVASSMLNKGYSKKLTNNVLAELNSRANEMSKSIKSPPPDLGHRSVQQRRNKRYSGIHWSKFNKMESISDHYSVNHYDSMDIDHQNVHDSIHQINHKQHLSPLKVSPEKKQNSLAMFSDESHNKRRRTLNGPDEVLNYQASTTVSPEKALASSPFRKISPSKGLASSPVRKISPSKGLMNLNLILKSDDNPVFAEARNGSPGKSKFVKPFPPTNKFRASSLEMAGVLAKNIPQLNKKPSVPLLNKKPSIPQLQKKLSIPQLQKKLSIPQLQKKPSSTNLQGPPQNTYTQPSAFNNSPQTQNFFVPQHNLQKRPSIPKLQRKSSIPSLVPNSVISAPLRPATMKPPASTSMLSPLRSMKHFTSISPLKSSTSIKQTGISPLRSSTSIKPSFSTHGMSSQSTFARPSTFGKSSSTSGKATPSGPSRPAQKVGVTPSNSMASISGRETPRKFTIPQQNTLYDKPTISSSQKSLNKFQRFKERFN